MLVTLRRFMLTFIVIQLITINVINHEAFDLLWLSKKKKKKTIEDMKNLDLFRFYIFRWNLFYRAIFNELNKIIIILISTYNLKFINWFIIMDFYRLKSSTEFIIIIKTLSILYNTPLLQFQFNLRKSKKLSKVSWNLKPEPLFV